MEESLMPPIAFLESFNPLIFDNVNKYSDVQFDKFPTSNNCQINTFSQTDNIKTCSKGSMTIFDVITIDEMKVKIRKKKAIFNEKIDDMKHKYNSDKTELNEVINNLNKQLSDISKENSLCQEELKQMKYYISGIENRDSWLQEKQRLIGEIEKSHFSEREQQAIIDCLKIQLSNMEKIQSIQEREIEKQIIKSTTYQLQPHEIRYELLLRTWRHKVLSLLVQQESRDVSVKKEFHQFQQQYQERQNDIDHLQTMMETMNLKLQSYQAQLSAKDSIIDKLKRENVNLHSNLELLNEEKIINQNHIESIYSSLQHFHVQIEKNMEIKLQKASTKVDTLQRRLQYALSRFPVIQANIIRSKNIKERSSDKNNTNRTFDNHLSTESLEYRYQQLEEAMLITNKEMQQLQSERDQLIMTIEQDSETFHDRIKEKKLELDDDMNKLQSNVVHLEKSLNKALRELEITKTENSRMKINYDELLTEKFNEVENLQAALNGSQTDVSTLSLEFSEFKRLSANDRKKFEDKMRYYEQTITDRESFWTKNVDQLKAECNLLKMTIRQEGILSKLKTRTPDCKSRETNIGNLENSEMKSVMKEVENLANELEINDVHCN